MEPGEILKLSEDVVNRIAAGEIIQRPVSALKELLENSLDAKSTFIQVTVKTGGLKQLQIQDNGTGIRKEYLSIVCKRFTTSKLSTFEDLSRISTFGFRGEALASISHVAHLTIQTRTAKERCGYKAIYEDGQLTAPPKAVACNQGTTITIEDLFYNMPQRKQCLKSAAEEFQRIADVVAKYAVHNACIGFGLKKFNEQPTLKTAVNSSKEENIRNLFGTHIAKELMPIELKDNVRKFNMSGLITKVNYASKKLTLLLFVNNRLVDSAALKTAIDAAYSTYLPKSMHPFIYISLDVDPANIDVNVHPTKHEVHFLYEDEIIEMIKTQMEMQLIGNNDTRTFYKQLKLPSSKPESPTSSHSSPSGAVQKVNPKNMVRTDTKEQKLEKFLIGSDTKMKLEKTSTIPSPDTTDSAANDSFRSVAARKKTEIKLTSILNMQKKIESKCSVMLRKSLKELVFVGVVDKTFALFQHETKLHLCNTQRFSQELFYQRLVYEFQNFVEIKLEPKLCVKELIRISLDTKASGWTDEDGDKDILAERATSILLEKAAIMSEYFSVRITSEGKLESLPQLLSKHCPNTTGLPLYLLRLSTEVDWEKEEECFESFCRETAHFYANIPETEMQLNMPQYKWSIEHIIYPAFKQYLLPPNDLKKELYELTNLPALYKVFERC